MTFDENMRVVVFVFAELSWRRGLCVKKSRRGTAIDKKKEGQAADAGGSAAREGGCGACGGRGAHFWVVRHLKVPI